MYKKGTILIRFRIDEYSSIGIGSVVRLEEDANSKYDNCLVTRLKVVEIPGRTDQRLTTHRVNLGDFRPISTIKRKEL